MVRHTSDWPRLNSPSVPRSETNMISGICEGTTSEASTLASVAKPEVCISIAPRMPPIQAPETMPTAPSSRAGGKDIEERIGVQVLDQRRQHPIRHTGHQSYVVALERVQHDLLPAQRGF